MKKILMLITIMSLSLAVLAACDSENNHGETNDPHASDSKSTQDEIGSTHVGDVSGHDESDNEHGSSNTGHRSEVRDMSNFKANRYEFVENAIFKSTVEEVFPLLSPEAENEYAPGWSSQYLWTESGLAREGAVFVTGPETWIISEYVPNEKVYFIRYNDNVITYLKIDIEDHGDKVLTTWTQSGVGLTDTGNEMVENFTAEDIKMICSSMEISLNYYLENGEMIDMETFEREMGGKVGH